MFSYERALFILFLSTQNKKGTSVQTSISLKKLILTLADNMAAAAASFNNTPQNYENFVEARETLQKKLLETFSEKE